MVNCVECKYLEITDYELDEEDGGIWLDSLCLYGMGDIPKDVLEICECFERRCKIMVDDVKVEFMNVKDKDLVILNDFHFCTIDYDGDYEVENTREHLRRIIKLGIEKDLERRKRTNKKKV